MSSFNLEVDGSGALLLIDKANLKQLDHEKAGALDILLDKDGKTELRLDFPGQKWQDVWSSETTSIRNFFTLGKAFIVILGNGDHLCHVAIDDLPNLNSSSYLHVPTGELIGVSASEVVQCQAYHNLEMETPFQQDIEPGWYMIINEGGLRFHLSKTTKPLYSADNVVAP